MSKIPSTWFMDASIQEMMAIQRRLDQYIQQKTNLSKLLQENICFIPCKPDGSISASYSILETKHVHYRYVQNCILEFIIFQRNLCNKVIICPSTGKHYSGLLAETTLSSCFVISNLIQQLLNFVIATLFSVYLLIG